MFHDCLSAGSPTSPARGGFSGKLGPMWGEVVRGRDLEIPVKPGLFCLAWSRYPGKRSLFMILENQREDAHLLVLESGDPNKPCLTTGPGPTGVSVLSLVLPSRADVLYIWVRLWEFPCRQHNSGHPAVHCFPTGTSCGWRRPGWRATLVQIRGKTCDSGKGRS